MRKNLSVFLAALLIVATLGGCAAPATETVATVAPTAAATEAATETVQPEAATEASAEEEATEPATEPVKTVVTAPPEMIRYYQEVPFTGGITTSGEAIAPLKIKRSLPESRTKDGVSSYDEFWNGRQVVTADLSDDPALAYSLTYSNTTKFTSVPAGYDPDALLEWGKDPGLNVDILHEHGFTGKGAVIAYVDQPIANHPAYANVNLHYTNNSESNDSMHGPTTLSMLAGREIGTAPEAEVYFYGHSTWLLDQATDAQCLYQIIEQNKQLPEGEKITMVGFSSNLTPEKKNLEVFREAVKACEEAGIMVWFCGEYAVASYLPFSDKNNASNAVRDGKYGGGTPQLVHVPGGGRTAANEYSTYTYWSSGGLSWTMPYVFGLYAIVLEIDPTLTQDDLRKMVVETAYEANGMKLINPVGFVAKALQNVGRNEEAQAMLDEVAARTKYLYAVMNTSKMNGADLTAIRDYLATMTDVTVLVVDAAFFQSAEQLYTAMQQDAEERGGEVAGVQIFGTADLVPAFNLRYKVQMIDEVDDAGTFLSDLFYGNFENDPSLISDGYNVMDHFAEGWDVDLVPQWPVARLPLSKGEFSAFFEKYNGFVDTTGLKRQDLVNFSNPIFAQINHIDDMGTFLNRMRDEFGLLDIPYRLYGNQRGQYPVTTETLGGFTAEELAAENAAGIAEFLINSHGQWDNIDKCYFENGLEKRESLMNMDTINTVLGSNPYYLDVWTCSNGYDMKNNLTTSALNGSCVGMFSATTIIANNGANCNVSLSKMEHSNFYYFYYHYLKALHEGESRSRAFFAAQQAYAESLIAFSTEPLPDGYINQVGNYQFGLYNLLAYHNFGVLEPVNLSAAFRAYEPPVSSKTSIDEEMEMKQAVATLHSITPMRMADGTAYFKVEFTAKQGMNMLVFDSANENGYRARLHPSASGEREARYFFLTDKMLQKLSGSLLVSFYTSNQSEAMFEYRIPDDIDNIQPRKDTGVEVHSVKREDKNGKVRFTFDYTAREGMSMSIIDHFGGFGTIKRFSGTTSGQRESRYFDTSIESVRTIDSLFICFDDGESEPVFVRFNA